MGIESNYVLPVKDHLSVFNCTLCSKLVSLDGYVTIPCHHSFCRDCFNEWTNKLHSKSTTCDCPNCGVSILSSRTSKSVTNVANLLVRPLTVAQPLAHRMLTQVKVLCPCRSNSQFCSWTGDYGSLEQHVTKFHSKPTSTSPKTSKTLGSASESRSGGMKKRLSESSSDERCPPPPLGGLKRAVSEGFNHSSESTHRRNIATLMNRDQAMPKTSKTLGSASESRSGGLKKRLSESSSEHERCPPPPLGGLKRAVSEGFNHSSESTHRRNIATLMNRDQAIEPAKLEKPQPGGMPRRRSLSMPDLQQSLPLHGDVKKSKRTSKGGHSTSKSSRDMSKSGHDMNKSSHDISKSSHDISKSGHGTSKSNYDTSKSSRHRLHYNDDGDDANKPSRSTRRDPIETAKSEKAHPGVMPRRRSLSMSDVRKSHSSPGDDDDVKKRSRRRHHSKDDGDDANKTSRSTRRGRIRESLSTNPPSKTMPAKSLSRSPVPRGKTGSLEELACKPTKDPLVNSKEAQQSSEGKISARSLTRNTEKRSSSQSPRREEGKKPASNYFSTVDNEVKKTADLIGIKEQANGAFKGGRYKDATDLYTDAINLYISIYTHTSDNKGLVASLYGNRAAAYLKRELFQSCLEDCDSALSFNKHLPRACLRKAWALKEMGRLEQASTTLSRGLADNPDHKELEDELAFCRKLLDGFVIVQSSLDRKQYKEAKISLSKMKLKTKNALILECKADLGLGNANYVIETLKSKILSIDIKDAEALELVAQAHFQNGDLDEAIQQAQSARHCRTDRNEMKPNLQTYQEVQLGSILGRSALHEKKYDKAVQGFSKAINGCADHLPNKSALLHSLLVFRAQAYLLAHKFEDCLEDTKKIITSDDTYALAWVARVKAYQGLRNYELIARELGPVVGKLDNSFLNEAYLEAMNPPEFVDLYKLFGVSRNASVEEIKRQYKFKTQEFHPDKFMGKQFTEDERKEAEEKFKLLGQGLSLLSDSFQRDMYDAGHDLDSIRVKADAVRRRTNQQRQAASAC